MYLPIFSVGHPAREEVIGLNAGYAVQPGGRNAVNGNTCDEGSPCGMKVGIGGTGIIFEKNPDSNTDDQIRANYFYAYLVENCVTLSGING